MGLPPTAFPLAVSRSRNQIQDDVIGRFIEAFILIRSVRDEAKNDQVGRYSYWVRRAPRNVITATEFRLFDCEKNDKNYTHTVQYCSYKYSVQKLQKDY